MLISESKLRKIIVNLIREQAAQTVQSAPTLGSTWKSILSGSEVDLIEFLLKETSFDDFFSDPGVSASGLTKNDIYVLPASQISPTCQAFYDATLGNLGGTGMGTDEKELHDLVFEPIATKINSTGLYGLISVAQISKYFKDNFNDFTSFLGSWGDPVGMQEILTGVGKAQGGATKSSWDELSGTEFIDNVVNPFIDISKDNIIQNIVFYVIKQGSNINGKAISADTPVTINDILAGNFLGSTSAPQPGPSTTITPIDPNQLTGSIVEKIEYVLDKYVDDKGVTDPLSNFTPDSKWDGDTDTMYVPVVNHGFANHSVFKNDVNAPNFSTATLAGLKWKSIVSPAMIQTYPGYTGNPKGLLNFLIDLYNDNTTLGSVAPSGGNKAAVVSGGGSKTKKPADDETLSASSDDAPTKVSIKVRMAGGTKLEDLGFPAGSTSSLASTLEGKVRRRNFTGATINLEVSYNPSKNVISGVKFAGGQRRSAAQNVEDIKSTVKTFLKSKLPSSGLTGMESQKRRGKRNIFELEIRFTAGTY